MTMAAAQAGAWPGVNGPDDVLDRAAHFGGPAKRMYGHCGGGSSRRVRSNPDRPCGLLDPCASKGACTGLRGPLVQQCTGGYPVFRTRRLDRCLYDPHADRGEHRVELGGELGGELRIPVPDQELQADTVSGTHRSRRWRCWTSGCGGAAQPPPALAGAEFEDLTGAAFALVEHDVHVRVAVGRDPTFGGQASWCRPQDPSDLVHAGDELVEVRGLWVVSGDKADCHPAATTFRKPVPQCLADDRRSRYVRQRAPGPGPPHQTSLRVCSSVRT